MIVTVTERGTFKRCRQMWDYASPSRQNLTPLAPKAALSFGSLVHAVHARWLVEPNRDPVDELLVEEAIKVRNALRESYVKAVGVPPSDDEDVMTQFYDGVHLAREVLTNYRSRWGSSLPDGFTLVAPEQTMLIPVPGTDRRHSWCSGLGIVGSPQYPTPCMECNGTGQLVDQLEATLDALLRGPDERLWVLERKTYGQRPKLEALQMNDQFLAYMWAVQQLDLGPVGGTVYDGMWKRPLEGKRMLDDLFMRELIIRSPAELTHFEDELRREVGDMASPSIYRNFRWDGCWDCSFSSLCLAEYRGEDADYIRSNFYTQRTDKEWRTPTTDET